MVFNGVCTALITPFKESNVDYKSLKNIIEYQIESGIDSLLILGTTGEGSTLSLDEKKEIIKFTIKEVNKRVPVMVGTGSNNTEEAIKMSQYAEKEGADSLLVITPYYNKTTQKGLLAHFNEISKNVNTDIIVYNVPGRTGVNIEPETVKKLSEIPNIKGIKEASGNIGQIAEIISLVPKEFKVFSGSDESVIPTLSLGGAGTISVLSNIVPKEISEMVKSFFLGKSDNAREIQLYYQPLIKILFSETNPIPIKKTMELCGYCENGIRLPLIDMEGQNLDNLKKCLQKYKLI